MISTLLSIFIFILLRSCWRSVQINVDV